MFLELFNIHMATVKVNIFGASNLHFVIDSPCHNIPWRQVFPGIVPLHERIQELIEWGARFDKDAEGDYKLGKEGGHSEFRILHHKDVTGKEMERALLETIRRSSNITLLNHLFVIDVITQHHLGFLVTKSTPDCSCYNIPWREVFPCIVPLHESFPCSTS